MKLCKVALLMVGSCVAFPLLLANEKENTPPYQHHAFDFVQDQIHDSKNYQKKWHRMTGYEHSGLHWKQFVVIYTNKGELVYKHNFLQYSAWFDDPEDEDNKPNYKTYPTGTTFIKENYMLKNGKPGDAESITVMTKRKKGFNPTGGDWEYMQFGIEGDQIIRGKGSDKQVHLKCASCHENIADRDYIFSNIYSGASQ